jgi:methionine--tRNA ligase beta chain
MYDRLFSAPSPGKEQPEENFLLDINPQSMQVISGGVVEPSVAGAKPGSVFQFERLGYFCVDDDETGVRTPAGMPVKFNRIVTLKDTWATKQPSSSPSTSSGAPLKGGAGSGGEAVEDVLRVEMRVGRVLTAERHPDADTLYVETVDCGVAGVRTVISGLAKYIPLDELPGRLVVVVCNLKPSKMRGILSEGMLLAASIPMENGDELVELLTPPPSAVVGELVNIEGMATPVPDPMLKSKTALDMYKRVSSEFKTNINGEATFGGDRRFTVGGLACTVASLKDAPIR